MVLEVAIGSLPGIGVVAGFMLRLDRRLNTFMIEHEMLMGKFAKDIGVDLSRLPTRSKGLR